MCPDTRVYDQNSKDHSVNVYIQDQIVGAMLGTFIL